MKGRSMNPISLAKSFASSARGLSRVIARGQKVTINIPEAAFMTRPTYVAKEVVGFKRLSHEDALCYGQEFKEIWGDVVHKKTDDVFSDLLRKFLELGKDIKNSDMAITIKNAASKEHSDTSIISATITNGKKIIGRIVSKVTGSGDTRSVKTGANILGQQYSDIQIIKSANECSAEIAKSLGVDVKTAQQRLQYASFYRGIDVRKPELMKKAIAGEFEPKIETVGKKYVYKQRNYEKDVPLPSGVNYLDSRLKNNSLLGRGFISSADRRNPGWGYR